MNKTWNVAASGSYYNLAYDGDLSINGGEVLPLKKFKKKTHVLETEYLIPLGNETAALHISKRKGSEPVLTLGGADCVTGQTYQVEKAPLWAWLFVVLYIINFAFVMGGAIGGAVSSGFSYFSLFTAADKRKNIGLRVLICAATYIAVTVVSLVVMFLLAAAIY